MKNSDKILKAYLFHFIYVPLFMGYSLIIGESISVLGLILFLSLFLSAVSFGFNYSITLVGLTVFKSRKIVAFIFPVLVALFLYLPINHTIQFLDFGGRYAYGVFIFVSLLVNLGAFVLIRSGK